MAQRIPEPFIWRCDNSRCDPRTLSLASPIAGVYLIALYQWQPAVLPTFSSEFWHYVVGASFMQILATALMVKLLNTTTTRLVLGWLKAKLWWLQSWVCCFRHSTHGIRLAWCSDWRVRVFMLSSHGGFKQLSLPTVLLGLSSGSAFALTSLWVREASLASQLPFPYSAAWVLLLVISLQTLCLVGYLLIKERSTLYKLWQRPRLVMLTSVSSCLGSIGWFSAMSLQAVPYVKRLAKWRSFHFVDLHLLARSKVRIKNGFRLILVALSAILVMWT